MSVVVCYNEECIHNGYGYCEKSRVHIAPDGTCEDMDEDTEDDS